MTSREECEKAYLYLLKHCYEATKKNDTYDFAPSGFKESEVFKQLIEEHFELAENTEEYKHFKLHSASTLKNQTKEELIDYIKMLYHNWGVCDEQLKRIIDKAKELSDSNDELRRQLYFCEPYKFEDLHEGMWVWDDIEKLICQIGLISKNAIHREYVDGTISDSPFEENRFFPVQCANWNGSER
ncbi:MAG: hypothetical protein UCK65_12215 [Thomasclavelia ramosa]|nr:hypothetical protein [Thomasclavelia ramosa]DAM67133.1 MAG TPA: hypothetical protein [Caudoviricetes sp.]